MEKSAVGWGITWWIGMEALIAGSYGMPLGHVDIIEILRWIKVNGEMSIHSFFEYSWIWFWTCNTYNIVILNEWYMYIYISYISTSRKFCNITAICPFHIIYKNYQCILKGQSKSYMNQLLVHCSHITYILEHWLCLEQTGSSRERIYECYYSKSEQYRSSSSQIELGKMDSRIVPTRQQMGNCGSRLEI